MDKPKLLCYNIATDTLSALTREAARLGIETVKVPPESYSLPLLSVASGIKAKANPLVSSAALKEGMLVFVNFPDAVLDVFLGVMRKNGLRISLKAILTPHNAVWDAHTLYNELCKERAEFSK